MTGTSTVAVVLAGGAGLRMGVGRPKQLLELSGRTLLERAISAFEDNELIDRIVVMASEDTLGGRKADHRTRCLHQGD